MICAITSCTTSTARLTLTKGGGKVDMPTGPSAQDWSGSFELKFAWKVLEPGKDDPSRFFTEDAVIMDFQGPDGKPVQRNVKVGLVGMHIGHKSETSPQWIWATFEQADNLDVDPIAHPKLRASFNDPGCPICATNIQPVSGKDAAGKDNGIFPRIPVQVSRAIPIPADKLALNAQVAAVLGKSRSVWRYYELIDTQWPTEPAVPAAAWDSGLAQAVANKPGGNPTPVFLTNVTMETYFQSGNQAACNQEEGVPQSANCPPVYNSLLFRVRRSARRIRRLRWRGRRYLIMARRRLSLGISTQILATESCMGCHSSAGVWTSYDAGTGKGTKSGQLTGDFSWLLTQKANWFPGK